MPLFVTEWGVWHGDTMAEREKWINFMDDHDLSWAMWSVHKKVEPSSILNQSAVDVRGNWDDEDFTEIGRFARELMRGWSNRQIF